MTGCLFIWFSHMANCFFTAFPVMLSGTEIRVHHTPWYKSVVQFSYTAVHDHLLIIACFGPSFATVSLLRITCSCIYIQAIMIVCLFFSFNIYYSFYVIKFLCFTLLNLKMLFKDYWKLKCSVNLNGKNVRFSFNIRHLFLYLLYSVFYLPSLFYLDCGFVFLLAI